MDGMRHVIACAFICRQCQPAPSFLFKRFAFRDISSAAQIFDRCFVWTDQGRRVRPLRWTYCRSSCVRPSIIADRFASVFNDMPCSHIDAVLRDDRKNDVFCGNTEASSPSMRISIVFGFDCQSVCVDNHALLHLSRCRMPKRRTPRAWTYGYRHRQSSCQVV